MTAHSPDTPAATALGTDASGVVAEARTRVGFIRLVRRYPTIAIGGTLVLGIILMAIFAPFLGTTDPTAISTRLRTREPSAQFWFGTDMLGRDIYSRVLYGARVSLIVGFSVAILASILGLAVGLIAGFIRSADAVIMRVMDGIMSIPSILLAVALMALTRGSVGNVILAITIAEVPRVARLVRGVVLSLREQPYVDAAVAAGTRTPMIIVKHILPNTLAPIIVMGSLMIGSAILLESSLSFLGLGDPNLMSWGYMVGAGRTRLLDAWWISFFPGLAIFLTVLALNLAGEGLNDALNPRLARERE